MKNLFALFTLFAFISFNNQTFAQSNEAGTLSINGGVGWGLYGTTSEETFDGTTIGQDTSGILSVFFPISIHYGFAERFSGGIYVRPGSYYDRVDSNTVTTGTNSIFTAGGELCFYIVNKDRFNFYTKGGFGINKLTINDTEDPLISERKYGGTHWKWDLGFNAYFSDAIGMFFNLGVAGYKFELKEALDANSNAIDLNQYEFTFKALGPEVSLGLAIKLSTN
jgi:hypothetical protein